MIVLSDMQCHDFMQIQTMRPWLRLDQAFISIAAEPPSPPCATIDLCIVRMLETPLKAFRTALCMAHKSDQQGDTMPKGAFDALNHISLTHLLVSLLFNMTHSQMLGKIEYTLPAKF